MKRFEFNSQTVQFVRDMCKGNQDRADEIIEKARKCFESEQHSCLFTVDDIHQGNNSFDSRIYLYRDGSGELVDSEADEDMKEGDVGISGSCIHVVKVDPKSQNSSDEE